ncbi:XcbB/CpsF family capsular polysaccharide biosynthesis protein [Aquabacterium sp. A7-Y]|uniref:XcbB/CpsF family capsular polysaccharide biosynthesis protein n=1 Tax=Aquabacterium sp. A7-Y TaxID=1349605 RepID=UPI00223E893C|nr:XcbB/CpsF family capsular polysaccharide biosynthesis protein [Aquabacterium sp. A7-Y]MCW7538932.1 XcbB/CpsF family capsular polysaccharide biosynthesis protein [Aquabacterium sp. A7-Y]
MLQYFDYLAGRLLEKNKKWKRAAAAYKRALRNGGNNAHWRYRAGFVLLKTGSFEEAVEQLTSALALDHGRANWYFKLGLAWEKQRKWREAAASYEKALALDPLKETSSDHLIKCLNHLQAWPRVEALLRARIAEQQGPGEVSARLHAKLGDCLRKQANWSAAAEAYGDALATTPDQSLWHYHMGLCFLALKQWASSEDAFRKAIDIDSLHLPSHQRLCEALRRQKRLWQEADALEFAVGHHPNEAELHFQLGVARENMGRHEEAVEAYKTAIRLKPTEDDWKYRLGCAYEQTGHRSAAQAAYRDVASRASDAAVRMFGIGALHQKRGLWELAGGEYRRAMENDPLNAELHYRLGMCHERSYQWREAVECYQRAVALDKTRAAWHFGLGLALERSGQWDGAAVAYQAAAALREDHDAYWFYRLGYALQAANRPEAACAAYLRMSQTPDLAFDLSAGTDPSSCALGTEADGPQLDRYLTELSQTRLELTRAALGKNATDGARHFMLGNAAEQLGDWAQAALAYREALARKEDHAFAWHYRLGYVLAKDGRHAEACDAFKSAWVLKRAYGVENAPYQKESEAAVAVMEYTEYCETLPVDGQVVLYESFHGASLSCNPFAIFKHLLGNPAYPGLRHVWVLNEKDRVPEEYLPRRDVVFVERDSDLYRKYLATAKYLINNVTFPPYFIRRKEQEYLNTWHGTPIKSLGRYMRGGFMEWKNSARNFLQATHLLVPNDHTGEALIDHYDIAGLFRGELIRDAYPRVDLTLTASEEKKRALRTRLGLGDGVPVVLYAPTWRGSQGKERFDTEQLGWDLDALAQMPCQLLFRGHHLVEEALTFTASSTKVVPSDIDTNALLSIVDILITDYSSICVDFMATRRPIIYYAYDLDEYADERGLYFDIETLPGSVCYTRESLVATLNGCLSRSGSHADETYKQAVTRFCPYDDGHASERVAAAFFGKRKSTRGTGKAEVGKRHSLLFFGGSFIPNGITTSFLNLIGALDPERYDITVAVEPGQIASYAERKERLGQLPEHVKVIGRVGGLNCSLEERRVLDEFNTRNKLPSEAMKDVYRRVFRREFQRMFGLAAFDAIIDFEGYSRFWASLMAFGGSDTGRRVIYMHNDMRAERCVRFPHLDGIFNLYQNFDALISVSEVIRRQNTDSLMEPYGIHPELFRACPNAINWRKVKELAEVPLDGDFDTWYAPGKTFVTLGRLSPEKGHEKLIRAFGRLRKSHPEAKLIILGEGPLRSLLSRVIEEEGLQGGVHLAGLHANPFSFLKRADCFVLSSNHEGQPLVLLEAMIMKKKIIATDIEGARGVLKCSTSLVENSEEGLVQGMLAFLSGKVAEEDFEPETYQKGALQTFEKVVIRSGRTDAQPSSNHAIEMTSVLKSDPRVVHLRYPDDLDAAEAFALSDVASVVHVAHETLEPGKSLIDIARKNGSAKKCVVALANEGYHLCRAKNGVSSFANLAAIKRIWRISGNKKMELHGDTFFTVEGPAAKVGPLRMLVVFSSVADVPYTAKLFQRNFFQNFGSITKYIPANTVVLRISDIGSVVGSFYMNNCFSSSVEAGVQNTIRLVAERYKIAKEDIVLYGASKGGTAALYHGAQAGYKVVAVDPIVSDEHYEQRYNDSHFTRGTFPKTKQEKFAALFETVRPRNAVVICSERSPQHQYIDRIVRANCGTGVSFFRTLHPSIKDHPDVGPNTINALTMFINGFYYGLLNTEGVSVTSI